MATNKPRKNAPGLVTTKGGEFGFTQSAMRAAIANLAAKPTGAVKRVQADQLYAVNAFGGSQGGTVRKSFVVARGAAQQAAVARAAGKDQLQAGGKTLEDIGIIVKSGRAQQAAAFAYAEAQEFQAQNNASDAQTAAVAQAAWEHKMAMEEWKYQQDYVAKVAARQENQAARGQALGIAEDMPLVASIVKTTIEESRDDGGTVDWESVSASLSTQLTDPNQAAVAGVMVQKLQYGVADNMQDAITQTQNKMFAQLPGYESWGGSVATAAVAGYQKTETYKNFVGVKGGAGAAGTTDSSMAITTGLPGTTANAAGYGPGDLKLVSGQGINGIYEDPSGQRYKLVAGRGVATYEPIS